MSTKPNPSPQPGTGASKGQAKSLLDQIVEQEEGGRTEKQRGNLAGTLAGVLKGSWGALTTPTTEAEEALPSDLEHVINAEIARIDDEVSSELDEVMHTPQFQRLEASWRGLHSLVSETEFTEMIQIRVLNVTKKELAQDLRTDYLESQFFKKIHDTGYGVLGGVPYGVLIGDFEFGPEDAVLLTKIGQAVAIVHAPFISAASPRMFGWEDFTRLAKSGPLFDIFKDTSYAEWKIFRQHPNSRYVGLVLPHILLRKPYGRSPDDDAFDFHYAERVAGPDQSKYLWGNAAYAYAQCLTGAFFNYYWCTAIRGVEGGGVVELPFHTFQSEGGTQPVGPTEIMITDPQDNEFSKQGFISLVQQINTPTAVFFGGQSCQAPNVYYDHETTASANLSAKLPNIFATSRFAHYLKIICRDKIGAFMSRKDCEDFLGNWIGKYVTSNPDANQTTKAMFPLREARVEVEEVPGSPGVYRAVAYLRPHFQLEEISIALRLVAELPRPLRKA